MGLPDLARALEWLRREHARRARPARRELDALLRPIAADISYHLERKRGMKVIAIRLPEWVIHAAKLLSDIQGGAYQERMRRWIAAGVLTEWRNLR